MNVQKVLILSPHTDDAELGCGGLISRFVDEGKQILWLAFSTAEESLPKDMAPDTLVKEFKAVVHSLGLGEDNYKIYNFKVRKLQEYRQEILEELIAIKKSFQPDLVIGPSQNDYHQDHQVISNEMIRAFKTSSSIICYELPWNYVKFETQYFIRLDRKYIDKKIELLSHYESQFTVKRHYFSEECVRGLAAARGSQVNSDYAEAFEVIRWID
jgi:LmbE family N-acetylglucosaminyl deacetylase